MIHRASNSAAIRPPLWERPTRIYVLRALLITTIVVMGALFILFLMIHTTAANRHVVLRVLVGSVVFLYLFVANAVFWRSRYRLATSLLILLYAIVSIVAIWQGGTSKLGDTLGYCLIFALIAVISWLFGKQIQKSLSQTHQAETYLLEEKKMLAQRLKDRTAELRALQLQEMQELYKFAELGQISTALIHDVANHLSVLTLDIEQLKAKNPSKAIDRAVDSAHQSILYLDDMVKEVRQKLRSDEHPTNFHVAECIRQVALYLQARFDKEMIRLNIEVNGREELMICHGDATRFGQIMTILIINALDAVKAVDATKRKALVTVCISVSPRNVVITIEDWGNGIAYGSRKTIFQPFHSTKEKGMGIGLYITKSMLESHFKGSIALVSSRQPTSFKITLSRGGR